MAIVSLVHATIIGQARAKSSVLDDLQEKGFLHIITRAGEEQPGAGHPASAAMEAYHYLKSCPSKRRQSHEETQFDQDWVVREALAIKEWIITLEQEQDYLRQRILNLEPWGDFEFPPINRTRGYRFWFYVIPHYRMDELAETEYPWECVYKDHTDAYVVVISREEPRGMPVPRTHTGSRSLAALRKRLDKVDAELEDLHWRRTGLTRWLTLLARRLASAEDHAALNRTAEQIYDDGELFYFEAWLPERRLEELRTYAERRGVLLRARPPGEDEVPPTFLENPSTWSGGESLVEFYTIPAYTTWDPSRVTFLSFVIFFAMIVSDAGYGLLLGTVWLVSRRRMSCASEGLCRLFGTMVAATMVYGVLAGSYFGMGPEPGTLLDQLQLLDIQDKDQMMFLSICIGAGHLILANSGSFLLGERKKSYLEPLGWVVVIAGGFMWWLGSVILQNSGLMSRSGQILLAGGGLCILLFSSTRPMHGWKNLLLRLKDGVIALTGFSRAFGDVLSYLRLFALGLASAQLAVTFNNLAGEAAGMAGLGTLVAVCILTIGHGLNLLLAMMSGVVHGLRLNYIEFFNWGLAGEGYLFKPLRKRRIGIWNQLS